MIKTKSNETKPNESANALARQALDKIKEIDRNAQVEKDRQAQILNEAKAAIQKRIGELEAQESEIDEALAAITGRQPASAKAPRRKRTDLSEARARVVRWMQNHKGTRYSAAQLLQEFPELAENDVKISLFLKLPLEAGELEKQGNRANMTYAAV